MKGAGGAPHTYVGAAEYEVQGYTMKDIHNARVTDAIQPSAIVFATEEAHVVHAVTCAHKFGLPVQGRSGMNQYEASCASGAGGGSECILVDTNNMWEIGWPAAGCQGGEPECVVPLGPGLSLGSAYVQLNRRGYAIPAGTCAQVRVAGLTLGGGKGWLTRKYGMLIDRLRAIDAVLPDGRKVHADETSHEHLFWLARGGGGNIFPGVVTAFYFELVPAPVSPATYQMEWPATSQCRSSVLAQWYEKMAKHEDRDLFARVELQNFGGSPKVGISVVYTGQEKESAKQLLWDVNAAACGEGALTSENPTDSWMGIVLGANGGGSPSEDDLVNNNCGWDLSGSKPSRTGCFGWDTEYDLQWAYRSLIMGAGGSIPQPVWDALAQENMYLNYYVEIDPTNGFASTIAPEATAYPHRDAGFVMLQQVMRGSDVSALLGQSAALMEAMTAHVPALGYYNYQDKSMGQYAGIPRNAYYGANAERVEAYLREYTEDVNGCERCNSWELSRG